MIDRISPSARLRRHPQHIARARARWTPDRDWRLVAWVTAVVCLAVVLAGLFVVATRWAP